jgi:hypothetical protein
LEAYKVTVLALKHASLARIAVKFQDELVGGRLARTGNISEDAGVSAYRSSRSFATLVLREVEYGASVTGALDLKNIPLCSIVLFLTEKNAVSNHSSSTPLEVKVATATPEYPGTVETVSPSGTAPVESHSVRNSTKLVSKRVVMYNPREGPWMWVEKNTDWTAAAAGWIRGLLRFPIVSREVASQSSPPIIANATEAGALSNRKRMISYGHR